MPLGPERDIAIIAKAESIMMHNLPVATLESFDCVQNIRNLLNDQKWPNIDWLQLFAVSFLVGVVHQIYKVIDSESGTMLLAII